MCTKYLNYINVKKRLNEIIIGKYGSKASLDGIFNPSLYFTPERIRIAFVNKETYVKKEETAWSPVLEPFNTQFIPEDANTALSVIRDNFSSILNDEDGNVSGFGYFNLSKRAKEVINGNTSSDPVALQKAYEADKDICWASLHISAPEYIVFGGTFGYVWDDLLDQYGSYFYPIRFTKDQGLNNYPEKQFSVWKMEEKPFPILIQTYHPSCPENVFAIIPRAINEIKEGSYILEKYEVTQGD